MRSRVTSWTRSLSSASSGGHSERRFFEACLTSTREHRPHRGARHGRNEYFAGGEIMLGGRHSKYLLAIGGVMLASWWVISVASGAPAPFRRSGFVLTSTTFKDGGMMPKRTTS